MSSMPAWALHEGPYSVEFRRPQQGTAAGPHGQACRWDHNRGWHQTRYYVQDTTYATAAAELDTCLVTPGVVLDPNGLADPLTQQPHDCVLSAGDVPTSVQISLTDAAWNNGWRITQANGYSRHHDELGAAGCTFNEIRTWEADGPVTVLNAGQGLVTDISGGRGAYFERRPDETGVALRRVRVHIQHVVS